ncbi:PspC domain-containing protein [Pseudonocardia sp. C8]|uniref:PspC domain-containing protein n=1 Tax=Pseudonocardia sp. C8 TaxID=2762759 RepID=UPI001C92F603
MDIAAQNPSSDTDPTTAVPGTGPASAVPGTGPASAVPGTDRPAAGVTGTPAPSLGDRLASYRLRRSTTDKMLGGVCGGLARDLGVDAALLRIAVLVLTLVTGGAAALVYLAAWIVAPAD